MQAASDLENDDLLKFYAEIYEEYRVSSLILNRVFSYINMHWVRRQREEGHNVYPVNELALRTFREHMESNEQFDSAVQNMMQREHNGENIDPELKAKVLSIARF